MAHMLSPEQRGRGREDGRTGGGTEQRDIHRVRYGCITIAADIVTVKN